MQKLTMLKPRVQTLRTTTVQPLVVERTRGNAWMTTRNRIFRRDNGLCQCADCRATGRLLVAHQVDHVVPLWEGGADVDANLQAINAECHRLKTAAEAERRVGKR
jgi:5-methylcytosine-specific restriction protein A